MTNVRNDEASAVAAPARPASRRAWRRVLLALAVAQFAVVVAANLRVVRAATPFVCAAADAPAADAVVVPGARIHADGRPYSLLVDRLVAAEALWRRGTAPVLLLSGRGGGGVAEDEVAAMRRFLAARGVPDTAMIDDPLGLRTIDTMRRCRDTFGLRRVVVVTNPFHVHRSVFLARGVGLEAHGVEAPYGFEYSAGTMLRNQGREVAARVMACWEAWLGG